MAALDDLTAQVTRVVASVDSLIAKLAAAPADNSAALAALATQLQGAADKADAVLNPPASVAAPAPTTTPTV